MLELQIKQGARHVPLFALPSLVGRAAAVEELGDTIESLMAFLDELDGDPDLEPDGDELDGNMCEDDDLDHGTNAISGPGCPISDPDVCDTDYGEKTSWEALYQGAGCARHDDDDDEPEFVAVHWPAAAND